MSRKYRHQGYQDNPEPDDRRPAAPRAGRPMAKALTDEERLQRKSLRHATAREANEVIRCQACGGNVQGLESITRESECPHCRAPLHCCRTCRNFDSAARWQCLADIPEAVSDKGKGNDCAAWLARVVLDTTGRRSNTPQGPGGAKAQFENLFKR